MKQKMTHIKYLPRDLGDLEERIYLNLGQHQLLEEFQHNSGCTKVWGGWLLEEFQHNQGSTKVRWCWLVAWKIPTQEGRSTKVGQASNTNNHGFKYFTIETWGTYLTVLFTTYCSSACICSTGAPSCWGCSFGDSGGHHDRTKWSVREGIVAACKTEKNVGWRECEWLSRITGYCLSKYGKDSHLKKTWPVICNLMNKKSCISHCILPGKAPKHDFI